MAARVAAAAADAHRLIVVGPAPAFANGLHPCTVCAREDPPGAGPVAAIETGVAQVTAPHVAVLAGDLPFLTVEAITALRGSLEADPGASALVPVDEDGRDQLLCSVWRADALRGAVAAVGDVSGAPVRRLVERAPGPVRRVDRAAMALTDTGPSPWFDCDTPADLAQAERWEQDRGA